MKELEPSIARELAKARNVDEDRILSAFAGTINATLRTNYYLPGDNHGHRRCICDQAGPVADTGSAVATAEVRDLRILARRRGRAPCAAAISPAADLRWSDRREDFRTEVLGLMKAQVVKNTVIVPTGAKGAASTASACRRAIAK